MSLSRMLLGFALGLAFALEIELEVFSQFLTVLDAMLSRWGDTTSIDIGRASCPKKGSLFNAAPAGRNCSTMIIFRSMKPSGSASVPGSADATGPSWSLVL